MTLDEFADITKERIPTAEEFVALVRSRKWSIRVGENGKAALRADATDPLAIALAKMMSREPYRTKVLDVVRRNPFQTDQNPTTGHKPPGGERSGER